MCANGLVGDSAALFDALGDGTRRSIFERLREGPRSVGELAEGLPVSRPAVSQHLRILKQAGLVSDRRDGTRRVYRVDPDGLLGIRDLFDGFWAEALERFRLEAEIGKESQMSTMTTEAIRRSVVVDFTPERAFELFTARIADWWPVSSHSYGGDAVADVVLEPRAGGRLYEVTQAGQQDWGRVQAWEPPDRLVLDWQIGEAAGTEVEVRFSPEGAGARVDLEHRGWVAETASAQARYESGWNIVLAPFVEAATR